MIKKYLHIIVPVIAVMLCSMFLFTPLDNKVYDLFLRALPSLTEDPSVVIVKIDDPAIENVGVFPWSRDVMADAIIFMKEMGAETVAFDLSYLDKSPEIINQDYIDRSLPETISGEMASVDEVITYVMDAISSRDIKVSEAEDYKNQILEYNQNVKNNINSSLSDITYDVDEYFADSLRFFGNSYLTISMISPEDIIGDGKIFDMSPYDVEWLKEVVALKNITSKKDTLTPEQVGILPAIPELLKNSYSAGFVNANPDDDGLRRRVHLVMKYNGLYYGQLTFVALLERFGNPEIEINNSYIILKDAKNGDVVKDIKIPRTQDGSVLIKWPKKEFKDYEQITSWYLISNKKVEEIFVTNLREIGVDRGFFHYWDGETPIDKYNNALYIKEALYDGESPDDGITIENYRIFREDFIDSADKFLNGNYEKAILKDIGNDTNKQDIVKDMFSITREKLADLKKVRSRAKDKMENSFSIIGFDATSMTDVGQTTFQELFPSVGIYSAVTNMILSEEFIDDTSNLLSIFVSLIFSIGLGFYIKFFNTGKSLIFGIVVLLGTVVIMLIQFVFTKKYIGVVVPFSSAMLTFLSLMAFDFLTTIREKSFLRSAFSRYLSPEVINDIISDPSKLNLGGEKREMTAIFTDIEHFSSISEPLDPADLVKLLNMYLTEMSNIIMGYKGTIDKYEGDAIICFFGAPIFMEEHAILACRTAIKMKKAEEKLNKYILENKLSHLPIYTRMGINTGDMVVGNMGSANKMDYTIMGNSVNLASRLEGVNKHYKTKILISENTREKIGDEFLIRKLDKIRVVGIQNPIRIYELLKLKAEAETEDLEMLTIWDSAILQYENQNFKEAKEIFESMNSEENVIKLFINRCEDCLINKPSNWDGVFNLQEK